LLFWFLRSWIFNGFLESPFVNDCFFEDRRTGVFRGSRNNRMNRLENWFCATNFWRSITAHRLLPWMLDGSDLGERILEIGAGPGAATRALRKRFPRVTSLEYHGALATKLAKELRAEMVFAPATNVEGLDDPPAKYFASVVQGDAAALPFASESFNGAIAILVLHHLQSRELQDRAFAEIHRVLKPGGTFLTFEIPDGWLARQLHMRSTFVPVHPSSANARLNAAGFSRVAVTFRRGAFLLRAVRGNA
jgi:SAM-dependent methyltransferase